MKIGTKSLLFGCHQVIVHPIFVFAGWITLYGWKSLSLQILLAIIMHDWGYIGAGDMDGKEGHIHPIRIFAEEGPLQEMRNEIRHHSRHLCQDLGVSPSRLCWADKLGVGLMPSTLWAIQAALSGEGREYMANPYGQDFVGGEEETLWGLWRFHRKYKAEWGIRGRRWGKWGE